MGRMSSISTRGLSEFIIPAFCEESTGDPDSATEDSVWKQNIKAPLRKNIQTQLYKAKALTM